MRSEYKKFIGMLLQATKYEICASMDCYHACASGKGRALSTTEINFIKNLGAE